MASDGAHFHASGQVPHLDHRIPASTDQGLSIRTDRDTRNTFCMTRESAKQCQFFDHERCQERRNVPSLLNGRGENSRFGNLLLSFTLNSGRGKPMWRAQLLNYFANTFCHIEKRFVWVWPTGHRFCIFWQGLKLTKHTLPVDMTK